MNSFVQFHVKCEGINTPSVKHQWQWQRQGERQIEYIGSMVTLGNGSGSGLGPILERHNAFQWI